jgi:hypothetical protein
MIEFFVWLVLICVVPFVFAMLELQFKESQRFRLSNQRAAASLSCRGHVISFTAEKRAEKLVRVARATGSPTRWRDRSAAWVRSEGDVVLKELLLHEIGLPSAPIGKKLRCTLILKSYRLPNRPYSADW